MKIYDSHGTLVSLRDMIGRGGEGTVYDVCSMDSLAAKIYVKPVDNKKCGKLLSMVKVQNDRLLGISAWPMDILYSSPGGSIVGILMPKVAGYKEIHKLYSPRNRLIEFPYAGWEFLIHAASNLARAFAVVHEHGHIVGDVNQGNIVVSNRATIMLIDCDSYQVYMDGNTFSCDVGVAIYQPPELQDISSFNGVIRTLDHDNFGLAVLIFQLLFMGRHPFSGKYKGLGEMPLEKAIRERIFVYSASQHYENIKQPPNTLTLEDVSQTTAALFERAFLSDKRPCAREWVEVLDDLSKHLKQCRHSPSHRYLDSLEKCPWCKIEYSTGAILFSPAAGLCSTRRLVDIGALQYSIPCPEPLPDLPDKKSFKTKPSRKYVRYSRWRRLWVVSVCIAIIWILLGALGLARSWPGRVIGLVATATAAAVLFKSVPARVLDTVRREYDEAERCLALHIDSWNQDAGEEQFFCKQTQIFKLFEVYKKMETEREKKLRDLQQNPEIYHLNIYLRRHRLLDAKITGMAPGWRSVLQSYGIRTAADIDSKRIESIPGFDADNIKKLLRWRSSIEGGFKFKSDRTVEHDIIKYIDSVFITERNKIEDAIVKGIDELKLMFDEIKLKRQQMFSEIEKNIKDLVQAEANLKIIGYSRSLKDNDK